jgi:hypothetical protein
MSNAQLDFDRAQLSATVGRKTVTARDLLTILSGLTEDVGKALRALDKRVEALESRKSLAYQGVWNPDWPYAVGDVVTHSGSLWIAEFPIAVGERPDKRGGSRAWRLAVKRGAVDANP